MGFFRKRDEDFDKMLEEAVAITCQISDNFGAYLEKVKLNINQEKGKSIPRLTGEYRERVEPLDTRLTRYLDRLKKY